jgi:hypothetical protein
MSLIVQASYSRMKLMTVRVIDAGTIWNKLGIRQDQSEVMRKVAMVMIAARDEPVKKNALNSEPSRARSLGCANSAIC